MTGHLSPTTLLGIAFLAIIAAVMGLAGMWAWFKNGIYKRQLRYLYGQVEEIEKAWREIQADHRKKTKLTDHMLAMREAERQQAFEKACWQADQLGSFWETHDDAG